MYYLTHENYAQLALIFSHYEQLTRESFSEALEDEFSSHTEDAVLAIGEMGRGGFPYAAVLVFTKQSDTRIWLEM